MLKQIELWGDTIIPAIKKALGPSETRKEHAKLATA
jgi:hypothetical protein